MCGRCSENCPSGVDFTEVLRAARVHVAREIRIPLTAALIFRRVLPRRKLFDALIRLAAFSQKILPGRRNGTLRHLPLLFKCGKWLPPLAKVPALDAHAIPIKVKGSWMRAGIFVGCLNNYIYPNIIDAGIALLHKAEVEAVVPSSQVCCGAPVLAFGDIEAARMLARRNQECFKAADCDLIITLCASCGRMLKHEYKRLLESTGPPLKLPVFDISEFLHKCSDLDYELRQDLVTYHDPCHLRWGQKISKEPRELLARACNFIELPGEMQCCGQAGAFHVLFPELAEKIGQKKLDSLAQIDAHVVASGCPGCILQLNDLFSRSGSDKKAMHVVEILNGSAR
jgi:glycolate oxidase iron-sulfur subunit